MTLFAVNPLSDCRWVELLQKHSDASIFHTPAWLQALHRTYGYEPVVFTTSPPNVPLKNGMAFCRIRSWLTGNRLVSLPFSDHCQPLVSSGEELSLLLTALAANPDRHCRYIELRPLSAGRMPPSDSCQFAESGAFYCHSLDLRRDLDEIFLQMHKSCVQRKIRRAEREGLSYEEGGSEEILRKFYSLLLLTRRRQGLPPQPFAWFRNLAHFLGETLRVRLVSKSGSPVASIITLRYKGGEVYKYGCSDARLHALGGMQLLFWHAIRDAKESGSKQMDLGRSDINNDGLNTFKLHLGARCYALKYYRFPPKRIGTVAHWQTGFFPKLSAHLPEVFFVAAGRVLYRHVG